MQAAGILSVTKDGRVLLLRRAGHDHAGEWAFPGGGVEDGENPEQAARREFFEETGHQCDTPLLLWTRRQRDGVDFWTYLAPTPVEEFAPTLNEEHDAHRWVPRTEALEQLPIHPGVRVALLKFDMTELDVAEAIRAGELVSPQRFGPMWLFAIRITGTGAAYRKQLKEFAWRDPSLYLTDYFVKRCNGLPVILEHPDNGQPLDGKEFIKRIVGTIMLPYIQDDAVWGIARIYEPAVATLLQNKDVSTSPMVVLSPEGANDKLAVGDQHILIEGEALLLDSVAIVGRGVWDQGGPPSGVQRADADAASTTPHEDTKMAEEKVTPKVEDKAADQKVVARADGDAGVAEHKDQNDFGAKLDAIADGIKNLRADHDKLCGRMDSFEKGFGAEGHKGEKPEKADGGKGPAGEATPVVADKAKGDGEMQKEEKDEAALRQEREKNNLSRDDGETRALRARLDEIEKRLPTEMTDDQRQKFVDVQSRTERVAHAFGDSTGAPRWLNGETLLEYRRRLTAPYKKYSTAWKEIDLSTLSDQALGVAEGQILADAMLSAARPTDMPAGTLREIHSQDQTGRRITRFVGSDDTAAWLPFTFGRRQGRINTKAGH